MLPKELKNQSSGTSSPSKPRKPPTIVTKEYQAWLLPSQYSDCVPTVYISENNPDEGESKFWIFIGHDIFATAYLYQSRKSSHSSTLLTDYSGYRKVGSEISQDDVPSRVEEIVEDQAGAPIAYPKKSWAFP